MCSLRPCGLSRPRLVTHALFGGRDMRSEREDMWKRQQEILQERRSKSGKSLKEAEERRKRVRQEAFDKEQEKVDWRAALARGEKPEKPIKGELYSEEDNELGIVIPLAPFGIPKYDNGERFDLKLPYVDKGWVDEDADPFKWVKNIFNKKDETNEKDDDEEEMIDS